MTDINDEEHEEGARSFTVFLSNLANGQAQVDLSEALHELVDELQDEAYRVNTKVRGELNLKIKLAVEPTGAAAIAYDVKTKAAAKSTPTGFMWVTGGGNLTPHNPRQQKLDLREVGGTKSNDPRDVGTKARRGAREV